MFQLSTNSALEFSEEAGIEPFALNLSNNFRTANYRAKGKIIVFIKKENLGYLFRNNEDEPLMIREVEVNKVGNRFVIGEVTSDWNTVTDIKIMIRNKDENEKENIINHFYDELFDKDLSDLIDQKYGTVAENRDLSDDIQDRPSTPF